MFEWVEKWLMFWCFVLNMINAFGTGLHFPLQKQTTHTQGLIYAHCMSSSCHSSQDFFCAPTLQRAQIAPHRGLRNCQFTSHWVHKTVPDPRTNSYTLWEGRKLWELLRGWARENQQIYFVFNFSASAAHIAFQFMHVFKKTRHKLDFLSPELQIKHVIIIKTCIRGQFSRLPVSLCCMLYEMWHK